MIKISASILCANFAFLKEEIMNLNTSGADMIHIDVMDGHFVPNITIGHEIVKSIKPFSKLPLDIHLMVDAPENQIKNFVDSGADIITIHPETTKHVDRIISYIKSCGIKAGIALLPTSSIEIIDYLIDKIDLILIMTVNPGFSGQVFINSQLNKIKLVAKKIDHYNIELSVDGGINFDTAQYAIRAGADVLVSSSYIYKSENMLSNILQLKTINKIR